MANRTMSLLASTMFVLCLVALVAAVVSFLVLLWLGGSFTLNLMLTFFVAAMVLMAAGIALKPSASETG